MYLLDVSRRCLSILYNSHRYIVHRSPVSGYSGDDGGGVVAVFRSLLVFLYSLIGNLAGWECYHPKKDSTYFLFTCTAGSPAEVL
jgi:hypothetical protein